VSGTCMKDFAKPAMRIFSCVENLVAAARLNSDPTKSRSHGHHFNCNAKKYHIPDSLS
jgi:hypothetical protein